MKPKTLGVLLALSLLPGVVCAGVPEAVKKLFPPEVGAWKLKGPQAFDEKTIFDYMDGGAEPYMNFTYKQLYVGMYENGGKKVVAELYDMGSPTEAYGAYTLDVDGSPVTAGTETVLSETALRVWKGPYFLKVFDFGAGAIKPEDATAIGKAIADKIETAGEKPKLVAAIQADLKPAKMRYFHKDVTLEDIYYIATKNVLELSEKTDGVWAECECGDAKPKVGVIQYPSAEVRDKAWTGFCAAIFMQPGAGTKPHPIYIEQIKTNECTGIRKLSGANGEPLLALCFECRNLEECAKVLKSLGPGESGKGGQ